jgi:hypothetical protein
LSRKRRMKRFRCVLKMCATMTWRNH